MARIFFALWPDAPARQALGRVAAGVSAEFGGRAAPETGLHLTLVFLGECDPAQAGAAARAAALVRAPAFTVALDHLGVFRKAGVAWAGCARPAQPLLVLQAALASELARAGFRLEDRPFVPHLTLARRTRGQAMPRAIEPVAWRARSFALVRSRGGAGGYESVAEWPLGDC